MTCQHQSAGHQLLWQQLFLTLTMSIISWHNLHGKGAWNLSVVSKYRCASSDQWGLVNVLFCLYNLSMDIFGKACLTASSKTAVTPLLTHWSYCSLALNHLCVISCWTWWQKGHCAYFGVNIRKVNSADINTPVLSIHWQQCQWHKISQI